HCKERQIARKDPDSGAILGRSTVNKIGGTQPAGARHVLHYQAGVAGNVLPEVPRQQARIDIVSAAGGKPDDDPDELSPVKIGDGIGSRMARSERHKDENPRPSPEHLTLSGFHDWEAGRTLERVSVEWNHKRGMGIAQSRAGRPD